MSNHNCMPVALRSADVLMLPVKQSHLGDIKVSDDCYLVDGRSVVSLPLLVRICSPYVVSENVERPLREYSFSDFYPIRLVTDGSSLYTYGTIGEWAVHHYIDTSVVATKNAMYAIMVEILMTLTGLNGIRLDVGQQKRLYSFLKKIYTPGKEIISYDDCPEWPFADTHPYLPDNHQHMVIESKRRVLNVTP